MNRYVAFLRGVSPMNCKMPELQACLEHAGFKDVKTLLSSGNAAFSAQAAVVPELEQQIEQAMQRHLGREFATIVRPSAHLQALLAADPFAAFEVPPNAKRVITFLRRPFEGRLQLPIHHGHATMWKLDGVEVFSSYVPDEQGPVFMAMLERQLGKAITTRTVDTVRKCAVA